MLDYDTAVNTIVDALEEILAKPFSESNGEDFSNTGTIMSEFVAKIYFVNSDDVSADVIKRLGAKRFAAPTFRCSFCGWELPIGANYCSACGKKQ